MRYSPGTSTSPASISNRYRPRERGDWNVAIGRLEEILNIRPAYMTIAMSEQLYRVLVQRGKARQQEGEQAGAEEDFLRRWIYRSMIAARRGWR